MAVAAGPQESAAPPQEPRRRRWLSLWVVVGVVLALLVGLIAGIFTAFTVSVAGLTLILIIILVVLGEGVFTLVMALLAARYLFRRRPYGAPQPPQGGRRPR